MTEAYVPTPKRLRCDFCSLEDVRWAYPTSDFTEQEPDGSGEWGSHGGWAACESCHDLIESGDYDGLVRRSVKRLRKLHPQAPREVKDQVKRRHAGFRASRLGPPVPAEPENQEDPTREDQYGEFMRIEGDRIALHVARDTDVRTPDSTLSAEAIQDLERTAGRWVMSRLMRAWRETGKPPQELELELGARLDTDPVRTHTPPQTPRHPIGDTVDGTTRARAASAPRGS